MPIIEIPNVGNVEFPDSMSQDQIVTAIRKMSAPLVGGEKAAPITAEPQAQGIADYAKAAYEVPRALVQGVAAPYFGAIKGAYENLTQGTNKRIDRPELAQEFAYQPESPVSQNILESMGKALEATKIAPVTGLNIAPSMQQASQFAPSIGGMVRPAVQQATSRLAGALRKEPVATMSGVGAAEVPEAVGRTTMAEQLRVPVKLSKGQATRDLAQQQFEIETAKNYPQDVGKPLLQAQAQRNENILQNFDTFVDATGKEAYGLRATGKVVDDALVKATNEAKTKINEAYTKARNAGETAELVDVTPVQKFVSSLEAESINAPIIKTVDMKLNQLAQNGKLSINDLEEVRKMVNRLSGDTKSNMEYGRQINQLIDSTTENAGGQLYKDARALRAKYAREFENVGVVDKLLSKKPGTTDRSVALEDVFGHSVLNGSLDDVMAIGRTLKKAGPEGQQAWKELQGQTIEHIKDQVTRSIDKDIYGNPVVSPAKFKAVVRELDQDGKLDYIFGKKGAQEVRDLLETTELVNAPLKGAANYSNTSSAIIRALDKIESTPLGKIPGFGAISEYANKQAIKKQVEESLKFNPSEVAKELRKGAK